MQVTKQHGLHFRALLSSLNSLMCPLHYCNRNSVNLSFPTPTLHQATYCTCYTTPYVRVVTVVVLLCTYMCTYDCCSHLPTQCCTQPSNDEGTCSHVLFTYLATQVLQTYICVYLCINFTYIHTYIVLNGAVMH